jgi:hypothetical protein
MPLGIPKLVMTVNIAEKDTMLEEMPIISGVIILDMVIQNT